MCLDMNKACRSKFTSCQLVMLRRLVLRPMDMDCVSVDCVCTDDADDRSSDCVSESFTPGGLVLRRS